MSLEGYFNGAIHDAWTEADEKTGGLYVCFNIGLDELPAGTDHPGYVVCRHPTEGEYADLGRKVVEHVGLAWPAGLRDMTPCINKSVRVKIKQKESNNGTKYENAYIALPYERKRATPEQLNMALAKLEAKSAVAADDDALPF